MASELEPVVDVHSHFVPGWYAEEATRAGHPMPDGMPWWPEWSPEAHLELMDRIGVERSLLSLSTPGVALGDPAADRDLARRVNDHAAGVRRERPDRFGFLASVALPDVDAAIAETERALDDLGADGLILQTNAQGTYVTDPSHDELWALLSEREAVVLLHPTSPPGWEATGFDLPRPMMEFLFDTTRVVVKLLLDGTLHRHAGVRVVVPHSGSLLPLLADRAAVFQSVMQAFAPEDSPARSAPLVPDALAGLWWDLAGTPTETHLEVIRRRIGLDRVVYGSDFCFTPESAVLTQVDLLTTSWADLGEESSWRDLVRANTERLLGPRAGGASPPPARR